MPSPPPEWITVVERKNRVALPRFVLGPSKGLYDIRNVEKIILVRSPHHPFLSDSLWELVWRNVRLPPEDHVVVMDRIGFPPARLGYWVARPNFHEDQSDMLRSPPAGSAFRNTRDCGAALGAHP